MGVRVEIDYGAFARLRAEAIDTVAYVPDRVAARASMLAPVDTGTLAASIHSERVSDVHWEIVANPRGRQGQGYAGFVELGTSKMAAQPYLRPACYSSAG